MYFDFAMPFMLFFVIVVAMLWNGHVEGKLKGALEEREFSTKDSIMLVATISVTVSLIVFIPTLAIMLIFLFAYSMLLFIFTLVFSDFKKYRAKLFCITFLAVSLLAAISSLFDMTGNNMAYYGAAAFLCLSGFALVSLVHEDQRTSTGERPSLALMPPALFILLYVFFRNTTIWVPYLLDFYGIIFAILIILYLGSIFTWTTTLVFAGLLTIMDTILVLFTGTMVSAATHVMQQKLPILVSIPPLGNGGGILYMSLGLGDFFFAGLIGIQTMKKFGKNFAFLSLIAIGVSFFIFETIMLNYRITAFPGTLMIICGWLPLVLLKGLSDKLKRTSASTEKSA